MAAFTSPTAFISASIMLEEREEEEEEEDCFEST